MSLCLDKTRESRDLANGLEFGALLVHRRETRQFDVQRFAVCRRLVLMIAHLRRQLVHALLALGQLVIETTGLDVSHVQRHHRDRANEHTRQLQQRARPRSASTRYSSRLSALH